MPKAKKVAPVRTHYYVTLFKIEGKEDYSMSSGHNEGAFDAYLASTKPPIKIVEGSIVTYKISRMTGTLEIAK